MQAAGIQAEGRESHHATQRMSHEPPQERCLRRGSKHSVGKPGAFRLTHRLCSQQAPPQRDFTPGPRSQQTTQSLWAPPGQALP